MKPSRIVLELARWFPSPFRILVTLSIRRLLPRYVTQHWVVAALEECLWPDGFNENLPIFVPALGLEMPRRFVHLYHNWEPLTEKFFLGSLRPGMTVVDVGAHIGYFTVKAAKLVGESGRVYSFEPLPENVDFLKRNLRHNDLKNVRIYPYAAGISRSKRLFYIADPARRSWGSMLGGFYPHPLATQLGQIEVQQVVIDSVISGLVHAVKIDVEGAEFEVLQGMERILSEMEQLSICVEWNPMCMRSAGYDPLALPDFLKKFKFRDFQVLDEHAGRVRCLHEAVTMLTSHDTPPDWYANLYASKGLW